MLPKNNSDDNYGGIRIYYVQVFFLKHEQKRTTTEISLLPAESRMIQFRCGVMKNGRRESPRYTMEFAQPREEFSTQLSSTDKVLLRNLLRESLASQIGEPIAVPSVEFDSIPLEVT